MKRRTRRALLFCPGTERRKIEKAAELDVDAVIIDLEDAAALTRKDDARETTVGALDDLDFGRSERVVRINPVGSGFEEDDLARLRDGRTPPDAIMLPKTERADHLTWLADRLAGIEKHHGIPLRSTHVLALIETALGVVNLREIAFAHERVDALVFGAEDLCGDIGATRTAAGVEVAWAKQALVVHAAAAGRQAIDTPYVALGDVSGLVTDTRAGLELGYTGRLAIHPRQVDPIVGVFTPTAEEIAAAKRLIAAHDEHQAAGRGVFELDGKMVDMPMVRSAERVLTRARNAGLA